MPKVDPKSIPGAPQDAIRRPVQTVLADPKASQDELRVALAETFIALQDTAAHLHEEVTANTKAIAFILTHTETLAFGAIMERFGQSGASLNVSQIARATGIAHGIFCTALRKLDVAGVLRSRSRGRSGTHIEWFDPAKVEAILIRLAAISPDHPAVCRARPTPAQSA